MCVNCWESECECFQYERLRHDANTLNVIIRNPDSETFRYESFSVILAPTPTVWWCLRLLFANEWFFYRYLPHYFWRRRSTLSWCKCALLCLVGRQAEMKTTRLRFIPSSLAICPFPAVSPNLSLKIRSTNESRLFSRRRHSIVKWKIKLTVRC